MKKTVKLAISAFLEDFVRGEPDEALRKKYELTPSDLSRVINELKQRGRITPEDNRPAVEDSLRFDSALKTGLLTRPKKAK